MFLHMWLRRECAQFWSGLSVSTASAMHCPRQPCRATKIGPLLSSNVYFSQLVQVMHSHMLLWNSWKLRAKHRAHASFYIVSRDFWWSFLTQAERIVYKLSSWETIGLAETQWVSIDIAGNWDSDHRVWNAYAIMRTMRNWSHPLCFGA